MHTEQLTVTKDNRIIEASYTLTLSEQRVLLACIAQIDSRLELTPDNNRFDVPVSAIADLVDAAKCNAFRDVKKAIDKLYHRSIKVDGNGSEFRWICGKEYSDGTATVFFSPQILPYLSQLSARFTTYKLRHVANFKSTYSIRLYELMIQWSSKGEREIEVERFREMLQLQDKYPLFKDLNKWVVQVAVAEINEHSNVWCNVGYRKCGRKVTHVQFKFGIKDAKPASTKRITDTQIQKAARPGETTAQVINRIRGQDLSKDAKPGESAEQVKTRRAALADAKSKLK